MQTANDYLVVAVIAVSILWSIVATVGWVVTRARLRWHRMAWEKSWSSVGASLEQKIRGDRLRAFLEQKIRRAQSGQA
jgi:hypothetical protein